MQKTIRNFSVDLVLKVKFLNPSHLLMMGAFNLREINWIMNTSRTNETHFASQFLECVRDYFFYQHVKDFARYRVGFEPSLLDLLFTNEENMINSVNHMTGLGKSDHLQLEFTFNCYTETTNKNIIMSSFKSSRDIQKKEGGPDSIYQIQLF